MNLFSDPLKRRWFGFAALVLADLLISFHRLSTSVIAEQLMRVFETTGAGLGFLHSSIFYIYGFMQVPAGLLVDRWGSRRVGTIGLLLMNVSVIAFGFSQSYWMGFASRALIGFGGGVIYVSMMRYLSNWFRVDEFATVVGFALAGGSLGGLLSSAPFATLVSTLGWRASFLTIGLFGLAVAIVTYLYGHNSPKAAGLPDIEDVPESPNVTFQKVMQNLKTILVDLDTWLLGAVLTLVMGMNFTVLGLWGIPFLSQLYPVSVEAASGYLLVGHLGLLVGSPAMGWLSDELGTRVEIMVGSCALFTVAYGLIALIGTPPILMVSLLLFATMFLMGGVLLCFTVVKESHSGAASGTAIGVVNCLGYFGAVVFPVIMGWALDVYWTGETVAGARVYTRFGYRMAFGIATLSGIIALACSTWLYVRHRRPGSVHQPSVE